jgi:protein SCO1
MSNPTTIKYSIFAAGLLGAILLSIILLRDKHEPAVILPELYVLPEFSFHDSQGNPFGKQQMMGKINVVDFMFTTCMGPCPVMSAKMKRIYERYEQSKNVQLVSISVDPVRDTATVLSEYSKSHGVDDDRWVFIREDQVSKVADLCENGFKLAADGFPSGHPVFLILMDDMGVIRGYYDGLDDSRIDLLITHIDQLIL